MIRRRFRLGRAGGQITASVYAGLVLIFLFAPLVVVVLVSFNSSANMNLHLTGFSTRWFRQIAADPLVTAAFGRTALAAGVTALISGALGLTGALGAAIALTLIATVVVLLAILFWLLRLVSR